MKNYIYILIICGFIIGCNTSKPITSNKQKSEKELTAINNDTVTIANEELEYQIIIIEPGFNSWLISNAKPEGFYSQQFLENRNYQYVLEWNNRVLQPQRFNPNLYEMQIDYQQGIDYGYEVNYKLYNYFIYFQLTYKQRLGPFVPRI
ncbi:DUF6146 family protein [Thalassobellus suaedae]|uniref:DUF6146 family protein n=1 Tax=Thalassobellus suaedae TaxID=3074124 RepID=A0ABY9Y0G5_9FLAO|nr:DUF6146 family protein [Flavobacteriaceae bacterium HL-DH14]WNH11728.1 DUF6146 family protein [Flavobacteriaceae bacterium HL-DH10]